MHRPKLQSLHAVSTCASERSWCGTRRKCGREASEYSRAQKQVQYLNILFIFNPFWEVNWFQTKIIIFKGGRPNRAPTEGQLRVVKRFLTILSRAAKMPRWSLAKCGYCVPSPATLLWSSKLWESITSIPKTYSSLSVNCNIIRNFPDEDQLLL